MDAVDGVFDPQRSFCNNGLSKLLATSLLQQQIGRIDCRVRPINFRLLEKQLAKARPLAGAETPEAAAAAAANAAATAATTTAAAATPATATAAAATTATPRHLLQGATVVFLVEEME